MRKLLNPSTLLLLILGIGVQLTFTKSVTLNIIVAVLALLYLLITHVSPLKFLLAMGLTTLFAFGTGWSFLVFGSGNNWHNALVYSTRLYAFLLLGAGLTLTTTAKELVLSLTQHVKLSPTFAYGILAAFNLLPKVRHQVKTIRYSAQLRGVTYHWWGPQLYFKAILTALQWSGDLAEAMTSHGFSEGFARSAVIEDRLPVWQFILVIITILSFATVAIVIRPW